MIFYYNAIKGLISFAPIFLIFLIYQRGGEGVKGFKRKKEELYYKWRISKIYVKQIEIITFTSR